MLLYGIGSKSCEQGTTLRSQQEAIYNIPLPDMMQQKVALLGYQRSELQWKQRQHLAQISHGLRPIRRQMSLRQGGCRLMIDQQDLNLQHRVRF